jgi:hypothetical protein
MKTTLTVAPSVGLAKCKGDQTRRETASSCAPGSTWDAAKGACTVNPTG